MAILVTTRNYADGEILTQADLDAFLDDIEAFINVTKLNDDNIQNQGITASTKILNGSISDANLGVNSVTTSKIADDAITTDKINDDAVTNAKLADDSVNTDELVDASVTTPKLADEAVTNDKIANNTITVDKLAFSLSVIEEFALKSSIQVRVATTVAGTLASSFDNGSVIDSTTLATNDLILVKNQASAEENGVYIVQASGAPVRHASYNSAADLTDAHVRVAQGAFASTTKCTTWFQNNTLASLSDPQSWALTPNTQSFLVPSTVSILDILILSGGGGGGGATNGGAGITQGGGGSLPIFIKQVVTPGDTLTITLGKGGNPGGAGSTTNGAGPAPTDGGVTTITGTGVSLRSRPGFKGANNTASYIDGLGSPSYVGGFTTTGGHAALSTLAQDSIYADAGENGAGSTPTQAGGGGGAGLGDGGDGGNAVAAGSNPPGTSAAVSSGAGGGSAGKNTASSVTVNTSIGGWGGSGYVRISYMEVN